MKQFDNSKNTADFKLDSIECSSNLMLHERELKGTNSPSFEFSLSISNGNEKIDTTEIDVRTSFEQNLRYWNAQTQFCSTNNTDNSYFRSIVEMGSAAVPYILNELKKGPTLLVYALDEIFPGVVKYDGYVSVKEACEKWISTLQKIGIN